MWREQAASYGTKLSFCATSLSSSLPHRYLHPPGATFEHSTWRSMVSDKHDLSSCRVRVLDIRFLPTLLLCRCREERSCALLSTSRVLVPQTTLAMTRRRMQCRPKRKSTHYTQQFTQPNSAAPVINEANREPFPFNLYCLGRRHSL